MLLQRSKRQSPLFLQTQPPSVFDLFCKKTCITVKTEVIAGMTMFFAMVYILMVNANMFADSFGDGTNPLTVFSMGIKDPRSARSFR